MATHIGAQKFNRNYLLETKSKNTPSPVTGKPETKVKLDSIDLRLLSLLNENSRYSAVELSKKLNVSVDTITYRRKKLEKENVILRYTILIEPKKLGYSYYRVLLNLKNINKEKEERLREFCNSHKNIIYFVKTFGKWEVTLDLEIEHEKIRDIINELNNEFVEIIEDYEILEVFEIPKFRYFVEE